jgi:hypothetical protein
MAHYLFNFVRADGAEGATAREQAARLLQAGMWGVGADERHGGALAPGDLALVYLAAPERELIGHVELASALHDWTPAEAQAYPGDSAGGVLLGQIEEWNAPVPMHAVLAQIDRSGGARADFETGVLRITTNEYETALAVARATQVEGTCSD